MDIRRRGSSKGVNPGSMSGIHTPRPIVTPPSPPPVVTEIAPIDLPEIKEPETVAPLVLAIAEELTNESDPAEPKKARYHPSTKITTKTVEIKISMPAVPLPNLKPLTEHRAYVAARTQAAKIPRKKLALSGILLAVALFTIGSNLLADHNAKVAADNKQMTTRSPSELLRGTPDYPTRLPAGKTIEDLGGWTLVSPPDRNPVYAYVDTIDGVQINVSQQPLPEDFLTDTEEQIELLARGYKASEKITVGDTTVHIGTSALGPQSVIFYKDNLLVLIKSTVKITSDKWAEYINSLL